MENINLYPVKGGILKFRKEIHSGVLFRKESFWIGLHYSKECKRYCLNLVPCLTIWWTKKGGLPVDLKRM